VSAALSGNDDSDTGSISQYCRDGTLSSGVGHRSPGYSGEMSSLYASKIVELLKQPSDRGMTADDNTVSQVLIDLINAGTAIPPDELRAVLLDFELQAGENFRNGSAGR